jgi:glycosyltransferase involved in cell wall biosynthesis
MRDAELPPRFRVYDLRDAEGGTMSRRILMFLAQFLPVVGGAERQARLLTSALIARGLTVEIMTLQLDPRWPIREELPGGIVVHRIPYIDLNRSRPRAKNLGLGVITVFLNFVRISAALRRRAACFDVLHAHNGQSPLTAWAIRCARRHEIGTVLKVANIGEWFDLRILRKHRVWGKPAVRWLVQYTDRWQAISRRVAEELTAATVANERIVQIPNGVQVPLEAARIPSLASRFLYLGRLAFTAPRDVTGLISAFESIGRRHPAVELALVGGGDRLEEMRTVFAASPLRERIYSPGEQDPDQWLCWAHCLVQPSFSEGMSNALLEGMARGLACVAYDIPPNREVLADGGAGVLVPVGDRDGLASALQEMARSVALAQRFGANARERVVTTYEIGLVAERLAGIYATLMPDVATPKT